MRPHGNSSETYINCVRCGKRFKTTPSKIAKGAKYCTRECLYPPHFTTCENCGKDFRSTPSKESRYCSKDCAYTSSTRSNDARKRAKAQWENDDSRKRLMDGIKERSNNPDWYNAPHFQKGEKHPRYKGNRTARERAQSRYEYKAWRRSVMERDNFTCQSCEKRGGRLTAHHIKHWKDRPELRYKVSNGQTLCYPCHDKAHGRVKIVDYKFCAVCGDKFTPAKSTSKCCSLPCGKILSGINRRKK